MIHPDTSPEYSYDQPLEQPYDVPLEQALGSQSPMNSAPAAPMQHPYQPAQPMGYPMMPAQPDPMVYQRGFQEGYYAALGQMSQSPYGVPQQPQVTPEFNNPTLPGAADNAYTPPLAAA